jgi:tripartite-type tricarboxylate transporter receptor subunit TctC
MVAGNLNGLFAPAGVPKAIVERIADATRKVAADLDFQKSLITSGFEPVLDSGPDATRAFIAEETARWVPVMKAANFKLE